MRITYVEVLLGIGAMVDQVGRGVGQCGPEPPQCLVLDGGVDLHHRAVAAGTAGILTCHRPEGGQHILAITGR